MSRSSSLEALGVAPAADLNLHEQTENQQKYTAFSSNQRKILQDEGRPFASLRAGDENETEEEAATARSAGGCTVESKFAPAISSLDLCSADDTQLLQRSLTITEGVSVSLTGGQWHTRIRQRIVGFLSEPHVLITF
jgi:hypothetical protein